MAAVLSNFVIVFLYEYERNGAIAVVGLQLWPREYCLAAGAADRDGTGN